MIKSFLKDENGQGMVEYGLIIGLISIVAIMILVALGGKIKDVFNKANTTLNSVSTT